MNESQSTTSLDELVASIATVATNGHLRVEGRNPFCATLLPSDVTPVPIFVTCHPHPNRPDANVVELSVPILDDVQDPRLHTWALTYVDRLVNVYIVRLGRDGTTNPLLARSSLIAADLTVRSFLLAVEYLAMGAVLVLAALSEHFPELVNLPAEDTPRLPPDDPSRSAAPANPLLALGSGNGATARGVLSCPGYL